MSKRVFERVNDSTSKQHTDRQPDNRNNCRPQASEANQLKNGNPNYNR